MSSAGLQLKRHQTVSIGFTDQVLSHCGEDVSADQMFCNDGEAGGVPVKPVATPEDEWFPLLLVVPGQGIGQRVGIIVQGRGDRHPGWFY